MPRRFPTPWTVHESADAYWVEDAHGAQFGFCYFRDDRAGTLGRAYLSRDEARRLAANIARLPALLKTGAGTQKAPQAGPGALR